MPANRWVYDKSVVARSPRGEGLVGATLVVARVGLPTPAFAGTGRHKGVPYYGAAMCGVSGHSPTICRTRRIVHALDDVADDGLHTARSAQAHPRTQRASRTSEIVRIMDWDAMKSNRQT